MAPFFSFFLHLNDPRRLCLAMVFLLSWSASNWTLPASGQVVDWSPWEASLDQGKTWKTVNVPGTIEDQLDVDFDGVSQYRTSFTTDLPPGRRVWLRFEAVATEAEVTLNGQSLGSHLGGWTPFEFDITEHLRADGPQQLQVTCDEKVGHNTQGFLPIIAPHFSGIWKPVQIEFRAPAFVDTDSLLAVGSLTKRQIDLELPVVVQPRLLQQARVIHLETRWRQNQSADWSPWIPTQHPIKSDSQDGKDGSTIKLTSQVPIDNPQSWSPASPTTYDLESRIRITDATGNAIPEAATKTIAYRAAFRDISVDGDQLKLNGCPLGIRGLLNWGYAPPSVAPTLDEDAMRHEIEFAQQRGFNLMKFCLWIPPKRYLELCDEMGMLAWIEYPTWHPDFSPQQLEKLKREYREFFHYNRNHPSVVLHSLTCETGPSADLEVIRSLYQLCKQEIPGAVVEDDSSWIQWNRVHDFYDDHPYGNNHTWPATLDRLKDYITQHGTKPLVLGEAIAADTWADPGDFDLPATEDAELPFYVPGFIRANQSWWQDMKKRGADFQSFHRRTADYAMLMRKYQIEEYRQRVPTGGYVVSVIRDFRKAAMGLIDYQGRSKWTPEDWQFQTPHSLSLDSPSDHRSFWWQPNLSFSIVQSWLGNGDEINPEFPGNLTQLQARLTSPSNQSVDAKSTLPISVAIGTASEPALISFDSIGKLIAPTRFQLEVDSIQLAYGQPTGGRTLATNHWGLWLLPEQRVAPEVQVQRHASFGRKLSTTTASRLGLDRSPDSKAQTVLYATRLDPALLQRVAEGTPLLLFAHPEVAGPEATPNDRGQIPVADHWFLRGGPVVFGNHPLLAAETEMLMELQHFDLAGPVVKNVDSMLDDIDPYLLLWDNHDLETIQTHGLVYSVPVGSSQILVTALNHFGEENAAGQWLLTRWTNRLGAKPNSEDPRGAVNLKRLQAELNRREVELHQRQWKFQPDPDVIGSNQHWQATAFDDSDWATIQCDRHWDSQGYEALDGWAWYRLKVAADELPGNGRLYLNFTGVDDHYRLYINGQEVGSDGNIETKETAFDHRRSYEISKWVKPGQPVQIAVAVYDWYGAGGIFRPVTLSTEPLSEDRPWLK